MKLVIRGGRIISPRDKIDYIGDILIEDGVFKRISQKPIELSDALEVGPGKGQTKSIKKADKVVFDATGLVVAPGFIDIHVHFREPGREDAETIETGMKAAAASGFTSVVTMPNTTPANDTEATTLFILQRATQIGLINVYPSGTITTGRSGKELAAIGEMAEAGIVAITDDGDGVMNGTIMRRALEYSSDFGIRVISHSEDKTLSAGGVMHEGFVSTKLGLPPIPPQAESVMIYRDISLSKLTDVPIHIAHVSTRESTELIRRAKREGIKVTAEAAPHHLTLTDEAVAEMDYDTSTKVNPPLRTQDDVDALIEGILDGTIDAIATDHAPHTTTDKEQDYVEAPFGIVGLESALPVCLDRLCGKAKVPLELLIEKFTLGPADAIGLKKGGMEKGAAADLTIIDPNKKVTIDASTFYSKGRNCPFNGWSLTGAPVCTVAFGQIKMIDGRII
ncbi:MAG: dihydroorotase [Candidatus Coatesbacteria bacterium]|nr:dihydroorotase [Candidatus Coatesbacteria bacterium]